MFYLLIKRRIQNIRNKAELQQKIVETEMMAMRAQMNPHFIFNCLNAIDNMIQTNQKDKATTYLARFAQLIRLVLESSKNNLVPFHKDYESLSLYLQLEQFRSNDKFDYHLEVNPELINSGLSVPPLVIQPFVENAIHHGLLNKTGTNRVLDIGIQLENDFIRYSITDNGVGRKRSAELNRESRPGHVSYGIEAAQKRIKLHNHDDRRPSVVITDLVVNGEPAGTKVEIWLSIK
jgi:sensor histidine kinase YesM